MKRYKHTIFFIFVVCLFLFFAACGSATKPVSTPRVVEKSAPQTPSWILTPPKPDNNFVYFVGGAENQPSLQTAKKAAVADATRQLVDYIGIRVTRKISYKATGTENDNVSSFTQKIEESIEGKGNANVSIEVSEIYYEKYENGTYTMYTLIKLPKKWVEAERARQQKLVEQQRTIAKKYLSDAQSLINLRYYQPALEALWQGLLISGKAAENEDIYEEIRTLLLSVYQRLSLQLVSNPAYAYSEGGSDLIVVNLHDTEKKIPVSGIPVEAISDGGTLVTKKGTTTDNEGNISYEVSQPGNKNPLPVTISFSFSTYSNIISADRELEEQILNIKTKNRIELSLKVAPRTKAQPTAVVLLRTTKQGTKSESYFFDQAANDSLSSQLASRGFYVIEIEMPNLDFVNEKKIKELLLNHIRSNYPETRRLLYVLMSGNVLGNAGDIAKMEALSGLYVSEVNLSYSWIDIVANKVEEGKPMKGKGAGLNEEQALQNGIKDAIKALVSFLDDQATKKK
ncbi:MAG: hypothetical protein ACK4HQ_01520 [Brevinematales bacterium]